MIIIIYKRCIVNILDVLFTRNLPEYYQIGDIVTDPVIINNTEKYKKIIFPIMATASTIAACLIIVFSLGMGRGGSGGSVNPTDVLNNGEIIETSDIVNSNNDRVDSVIPLPEDEESTQKGEEETSKIIEDDTTKEYEEDTNKNTENDTEGPMTESAAKMIALTHAKLKAEDVEFTGSNLQDVDERYVYKISFKTKNNPSITYYNYEIDAITGEVLLAEKN